MSTENEVFCPFCGSLQERGQKYCYNCGANLEDLSTESDLSSTGVRILGETPLTEHEKQTTYTHQQNFSYGSSTSRGSYRTQYSTTATGYYPKKDNANIALLLGIIGFFVGCCIVPIIGFVYLNKAKQYNEDPKTIRTAQILLWIQLILVIIGLAFYFIVFLARPFLYY